MLTAATLRPRAWGAGRCTQFAMQFAMRAAGLGGPLHARGDDESSVSSMATTFSCVSVNKGHHAGLLAVEPWVELV